MRHTNSSPELKRSGTGVPADLDARLRFLGGSGDGFGPGKAKLLRSIAAAGSIRTAAKDFAMSYNRAWTLVRDMNRLFREPLVEVSRGGGDGGGARLTKMGLEVLSRYSRMEQACRKATRADWKALQLLLK